MAHLTGGDTDKKGNYYENKFVISKFAELLNGELLSVKQEAYDRVDENGVDIIVVSKNSEKIFYQCKSRNGINNIWSIADLKGVIEKAFSHTRRGFKFILISPVPCTPTIKDFCDRSKAFNNLKDFEINAIGGNEQQKEFEKIKSYFPQNSTDEQILKFFNLFSSEVLPDDNFFIKKLLFAEARIQNTDLAFDLLCSYIQTNNKLGILICEDDLRNYLKKEGVLFLAHRELNPAHNMEFARNSAFQDRGRILDEIEELFDSKPFSVVIIAGLGGVGKTQLAIEFVYKHFVKKYNYICWLNCENKLTIVDSLKKFLIKTGVPYDSNITDDELFHKFANWQNSNSDWLIVYDNADEKDYVLDIIPCCAEGKVLITSRLSKWDNCFVKNISVFKKKEAINFLTKRTGSSDKIGAKNLVKTMGCLPLALEQAASYIVRNGSFDDYIAAYNRKGIEIFSGFSKIDYKRSVDITWNVTIEKITDQRAKQLMHYVSLYSSNGIDENIFFYENNYLLDPLYDCMADSYDFGIIKKILQDYSLISLSYDGKKIFMHKLLQEVVRKYIDDNDIYMSAMSHANDLEHDCKTYSEITNIITNLIALSRSLELKFPMRNMLTILYTKIDSWLQEISMYGKSIKWLKKALLVAKHCANADDFYIKTVARTMYHLGVVYEKLDSLNKAKWWLNQASKIEKTITEKDYALYFNIKNALALVYQKLELYDNALETFFEILESSEKTVFDDIDIANVHVNLTHALCAIADYQRALTLNLKKFNYVKENYCLFEAEAGAMYACQLYSTYADNIINTNIDKKDFKEALTLVDEAIEYLKTKESPEFCLVDLYKQKATIYHLTEELKLAAEFYQTTIDICIDNDIFDHTTITLYNDMAIVLKDLGELKPAKKLLQFACNKFKECYGEIHTETLNAQYNLAEVLFAIKEYDEAIVLYNCVTKPMKDKQVANEVIVRSLCQKSIALIKLSDFKEAINVGLQAIEASNSDKTRLLAVVNLAEIYIECNQLKEALNFYQLAELLINSGVFREKIEWLSQQLNK